MFLEKDESEKLLSIPAGLAFHYFYILCNYSHFFISPSSFENFVCMNGAKPMSKHFFNLVIFWSFAFSTLDRNQQFTECDTSLTGKMLFTSLPGSSSWFARWDCLLNTKYFFANLKKNLVSCILMEKMFGSKMSAIFRLGFLHTWSTMLGSNHFTKMHQNSRAKTEI